MGAEWFGARPEPSASADSVVGAVLDADGVAGVSMTDARSGVLAYRLALAAGDDVEIVAVWRAWGTEDPSVLRKTISHLVSGVVRPALDGLNPGSDELLASLRERARVFEVLAE